jgi:glutamyl-tRNA reductase
VTLLAVGLSHRTAPVGLLEQAALDAASAALLRDDVASSPHVLEALVVPTCNRLEVYVDVAPAHRGALDLALLISRRTGVPLDRIAPHLAVHEGDDVVRHLFALVCGLDSMVVGEAQVLGQVRAALRSAQDAGTVGRSLNDLAQQALRVGKRAHAETGIDQAAPSVVSTALDVASGRLGGLAGRRAVVVGAGAMGGLAVALLRRAGVDDVVVTGRTPERVARLASSAGVRAVAMHELSDVLSVADVLVSCTGANGVVVGTDVVRAARDGAEGELVCLDLALPHDVDPAVEALPGVSLVGIADLADIVRRSDDSLERDLAAVRRIVDDEVSAQLSARRADLVTPTVVALRERAAEIADAELAHLDTLDLDPEARAEAARSVRRLVSALLHTPILRMKELAAAEEHAVHGPGAEALLREIFDVTLGEVATVTRAHLAAEGSAS